MRRRLFVSLTSAVALAAVVFALQLVEGGRWPFGGSAGSIRALAPAGAIEPDTEFVWTTGRRATMFRLTIADDRGAVFVQDTQASRVRLPEHAWRQLRPGVQYWWSVTALDRHWTAVASTGRQPFSVRTP